MFFTPQGNAIHGTYAVGNLGRAVSHGCVRLAPQNAALLFSLVQSQGMYGAQVVITGPSPGLPPGMVKRTGSRKLAMRGLFDSLQ